MPGGYAHLYLVNMITDRIRPLPDLLKHAFGSYFHFCELGSVSPDLPYLAFGNQEQQEWANTMHYDRTFEFVKEAAPIVRSLAGAVQLKCLSWLMGYASHLVMDGTVHPVVRLKVGDYAEHKKEHRLCELHQDSYIFGKMNYGEPGEAEPFKSGPKLCKDQENPEALDRDLVKFWRDVLQAVHPGRFINATPNPDLWFRRYVAVMDEVVEEGYRLLPLARHIMVDMLAMACPAREVADPEFYENLVTPDGRKDYDHVIDLALTNLLAAWMALGASIAGGDEQQLASIQDFNLDTGEDAPGKLIWWA